MEMETYIQRNAPHVVENLIYNTIHGGDLYTLFQHVGDHEAEFGYCNPADFRDAVRKVLATVTASPAALLRYAGQRREMTVSPATRSARDYIRVLWGTDLDPAAILDRLRLSDLD